MKFTTTVSNMSNTHKKKRFKQKISRNFYIMVQEVVIKWKNLCIFALQVQLFPV